MSGQGGPARVCGERASSEAAAPSQRCGSDSRASAPGCIHSGCADARENGTPEPAVASRRCAAAPRCVASTASPRPSSTRFEARRTFLSQYKRPRRARRSQRALRARFAAPPCRRRLPALLLLIYFSKRSREARSRPPPDNRVRGGLRESGQGPPALPGGCAAHLEAGLAARLYGHAGLYTGTTRVGRSQTRVVQLTPSTRWRE